MITASRPDGTTITGNPSMFHQLPKIVDIQSQVASLPKDGGDKVHISEEVLPGDQSAVPSMLEQQEQLLVTSPIRSDRPQHGVRRLKRHIEEL